MLKIDWISLPQPNGHFVNRIGDFHALLWDRLKGLEDKFHIKFHNLGLLKN